MPHTRAPQTRARSGKGTAGIDVDRLTPMDAMTLLAELKKEL